MPGVLDATIVLLESVPPVLDAARSERYEIQHQIGAGGHAEVLRGVVRGADGFQRLVAVKRVRSDLADQERFATKLIDEALHASQLSHPNVVSIRDCYRDKEGLPYLVMEHVDGVDLDALIEAGPVPYPVSIFIMRELLSALGYIHELRGQGSQRGLVHRDVKPHNVLLSWEGEVKLSDFGLAHVLEGPMSMTVGADAAGTPGYRSPEQARREQLDGRSDLYAVGIMLWELLARERLRAGGPGDVKASTVFHAIPRPGELQPVPADLEAVTMRLLAFEREDRYRTAELAAHDLMGCQDAPRDGRRELVRLLEERFPRDRRRDPLSRPPVSSMQISRPTVTMNKPAAPWPPEQEDDESSIGLLERVRWSLRWWGGALAFVVLFVLFVLVLGALLALLMTR